MTDLIKHYRQLVGIAKSWAGKNLPNWCDENHRDLLAKHGAIAIDGRFSASTLNMAQLSAVLEDYERRGWPRHRKEFTEAKRTKAAPRPAAQPIPGRIAHIVRLWSRLGQAGQVGNASRSALLAFCQRQVKHAVPDLDSLTVAECQSITEALKAWMGRAA